MLTVPETEFRARCANAAEAALARGFGGLVVWGRGGGPVDGGADLLYLTDHYTPFPTLPDLEGRWAGRGYGCAVVDGDGGVVLVADVGGIDDHVVADEVVVTNDLVHAAAAAIRDLGTSRPIGVVSAESMPATHWSRLHGLLPDLDLQTADDIVRSLRMRKSPTEQELIRRAGKLGVSAMAEAMLAATEGADEAMIAGAAAQVIAVGQGVVYNLFADSWGPDRGHVRRRMPTWVAGEALRRGESFAIDMSGALSGYLFDFARTKRIGAGNGGHRLYDVARGTVEAVVEHLGPGVTLGDAVRRGLEVLQAGGLSDAPTSFHALGHGLGLGWEEPWLFPEDETVLEPGMYLAVEKDVWGDDDGAAFEVDVLITESGVEVVTAAPA